MGTNLVTYEQKWAVAADKFVEQVRKPPAGDILSIRGGMFRLGDDELGDQLCVTVLNSLWENTYYPGKWVEGSVNSPICYAFGRSEEEMAPHISMAEHPEYFQPQNETCTGCPMNEWGSADTGKGKACQNRERLAIIPAGEYRPRPKSRDFDLDLIDGRTPDGQSHFRDADALVIKLPVTSVGGWNEYVRKIGAATGRPPYGVATRMYIEKHPKFQYQVKFEMIDLLPNELFEIVQARNAQLNDDMIQPYSPPREETERRSGVKGLVRR